MVLYEKQIMYFSQKKKKKQVLGVLCEMRSLDDILKTCVKLKGQLALNRGSLWFLSTASALNPQLPEVINMKLFPKISIDISCKQVMRIFTLIR